MTDTPGPAESLRLALIARFEAFVARTGIAETTLARRLANSPRLMARLRSDPRVGTLDRVTAKLDELEAQWAAEHPHQGETNGKAEADRCCGDNGGEDAARGHPRPDPRRVQGHAEALAADERG